MQINSIRFKASILYSCLLAVILSAFSAGIYFCIKNILYDDIDEELRIKAQETTSILLAYEKIDYTEKHPIAQVLEMLKRKELGMSPKMIIDDLWRSQVEALNLKDDFIHLTDAHGHEALSSDNFKEDIYILFKEEFPVAGNKVAYGTIQDDHY